MAIARAEFIARARVAFRKGVSQTRFIADMKAAGLSYRRTDMINDFHTVSGIEKKSGLMQYVRKNYYPSKTVMAATTWRTSTEYTYTLRVKSRISPDAPITERMVKIPADRPLTPMEAEELTWEMIKGQSPKLVGLVEEITPWSAMQRV